VKLASLLNRLLRSSFGMSRPPIISLAADVAREMELVTTLGDIEVAVGLMGSAASTPAQLYSSLNCKIWVETDAKKLALLKQSVATTHASTFPHSSYSIDIQNIYAIEVQKRKHERKCD